MPNRRSLRLLPTGALRAALLLLLVTVALPALGFAEPVPSKYNHLWLPDEASSYAGKIDAMFYFILWLTLAVFFLVEVTLVVFLFKYKYKPGRKAVYTHGNNKLEITWTAIPAVILVFLAIFSNTIWSEIRDPNKFPKGSAIIKIDPRQFQWPIIYAGKDNVVGTADDISTINQLYLAKGQPVQIKLQGQDVIHSFFVPEFRIKQDAVPGMPTAVWINPTREGEYEIACAELCGIGHSNMRGYVHVVSPDSLASWLKSQEPVLEPPPAPAVDTAMKADTTKH